MCACKKKDKYQVCMILYADIGIIRLHQPLQVVDIHFLFFLCCYNLVITQVDPVDLPLPGEDLEEGDLVCLDLLGEDLEEGDVVCLEGSSPSLVCLQVLSHRLP